MITTKKQNNKYVKRKYTQKGGTRKTILEHIQTFIDAYGIRETGEQVITFPINVMRLLILFISSNFETIGITNIDYLNNFDESIIEYVIDAIQPIINEIYKIKIAIIIEDEDEDRTTPFFDYLANIEKPNSLLDEKQLVNIKKTINKRGSNSNDVIITELQNIINPSRMIFEDNTFSAIANNKKHNQIQHGKTSKGRKLPQLPPGKPHKPTLNTKHRRQLPERPTNPRHKRYTKPNSNKTHTNTPGADTEHRNIHPTTRRNNQRNNQRNNRRNTRKQIRNLHDLYVLNAKKQDLCAANTALALSEPLPLDRYQPVQYNYRWAANACYYHSALQLLKNIPELIGKILEHSGKPFSNPLLANLAVELVRHGYPTEDSKHLVTEKIQKPILNDKLRAASGWGSCLDSQEMLMGFIDLLPDPDKLCIQYERLEYTFNNETSNYIRTKTTSDIILQLSSREPHHFARVQDILDLPANNDVEVIPDVNIYNEKGKETGRQETIKKYINIQILDTTQYLLIQLKIFDFDMYGRTNKINLHIDNLNEFICADGVLFEPISIIAHRGAYGGGHYINYSKQTDGRRAIWYMYDDTASSENPTPFGNIVKMDKDYTPYVILYKKLL